MTRLALGAVLALAGCFTNPTVSVDTEALSLPRGTATDVLVSIDGVPVWDLDEVMWRVDDDRLASVTPSYDGYHLRVGGDRQGDTVVHVLAHGQDIAIPTHIGPPAIIRVWTEPENVMTKVGQEVRVRAFAFDTVADVHDITFSSRWDVRDESIADLDQSGMMLKAYDAGTTTIHVSHGDTAAVVPVAVFK